MNVPWEDAAVSFPANLGLTWWESLTRPGRFFSGVDWDGPLSRPILYWLLIWIAAAALSLLWVPAELVAVAAALGEEGGVDGRLLQLLSFFLSPFIALVTLAVAMALHHVASLLLAPERRGIEATGRVVCYAGGPLVLTSLPVPWLLDWAVTIAVWVWIVTLLVAGFREAHRTSTGRAAAIVAVPMAIVAMMSLVVLLGIAAVLARFPELPA